MASRFIDSALPAGRNTLDVPVAALAGLSVAFLAFAAPADLIAELAGATGLAGLLPAEAPVGANARIFLGAAGAVLVFALAFLLLRWLDRFGANRARSAEEAAEEAEPPRLRRRDFHPDAPARRPILAAHEIPEPDLKVEPEAEPEPEPVMELLDSEPEPEPQPERPAPARQGGSLPELLERLEQGLARRRADVAAPAPAAAAEQPAPPPQVFPEPADDRLQSAIDSLQRLAARHD